MKTLMSLVNIEALIVVATVAAIMAVASKPIGPDLVESKWGTLVYRDSPYAKDLTIILQEGTP